VPTAPTARAALRPPVVARSARLGIPLTLAMAASAGVAGCAADPHALPADETHARIAAGTELRCRIERPVGTRVKREVCSTAAEDELRRQHARTLVQESLVALHGGVP
jgi:hypothetical protein